MKTWTEDRSYTQIVTVAHQGRAFVFATAPSENAPQGHPYDDLYYGLLDAPTGVADDPRAGGGGEVRGGGGHTVSTTLDEHWTELAPLPCATRTRPVGMNLLAMTIAGRDAAAAPNTTASISRQGPITVVSDGDYLNVFRPTTLDPNSLLVERYLYQSDDRRLLHATETRYVRSGDPDVPASDDDTFGSADLDGNPFIEPALVLSFASAIDNVGSFAVVKVPGTPAPQWHFFIPGGTSVAIYSIPSSFNVPFDLSTIRSYSLASGSGWRYPRLAPVAQCSPVTSTGQAITCTAPSAALHYWQEPARSSDGAPIDVMTTASVLLACATGSSGTGDLLALDFAVARDGHLAGAGRAGGGVAYALTVPPRPTWGTALELNGRSDYVTVPPTAGFASGVTIELWFQPYEGGPGVQCLFEGTNESNRWTATIDQGVLVWTASVGAGPESGARSHTVRLAARAWACASVSLEANGYCNLYLNGESVGSGATQVTTSNPLGTVGVTVGKDAANHYFRGAVSELRVWSGALTPMAIAALMNPASGALAANATQLVYRFPLDDGTGVAIVDASTGTSLAAAVSGGRWINAATPNTSSMPILGDADFLPIRGNVITGASPRGAVSLLPSADGLLRAAYRRADAHWGVVHYAPRMQRAHRACCWRNEHESVASPKVMFTSTVAGSARNTATVSIGGLAAGFVSIWMTETGDAAVGIAETWSAVPAQISDLVAIVNGERPDAATDPDAPRAYDYAANVRRTRDGVALAESELPARPNPHASLLFTASSVGALDTVDQPVPTNGLFYLYGAGADPRWVRDPIPAVIENANVVMASAATDKLALADDVSLEAWVDVAMANSVPTGVATVLSQSRGGSPYAFGLDAQGRLWATKGTGNNLVSARSQASVLPAAGAWTHVAATYHSSWGLALHDGAWVESGKVARTPKAAITVEGWVRTDLATGRAANIITHGAVADGQFQLGLDDSRRPCFAVLDEEGGAHAVSYTAALAVGQWAHLTGQYRAAGTQNLLSFTNAQYLPVLEGEGLSLASTIELWIRPVAWTGSNDAVLVSCGRMEQNKSLFELAIDHSNNQLYVRAYLGPGTAMTPKQNLCAIELGATLAAATPQHVAVTVAISAGSFTVECFLDGVSKNVITATYALPTTAAAHGWLLGAQVGGDGAIPDSEADGTTGVRDHYTGGMWDVRLWSVVRTQQEIIDHLNTPVSTQEPGLRGAWSLDTAPSDPFFDGVGDDDDDDDKDFDFTMRPRATNAVTGTATSVHGDGAAYTAFDVKAYIAVVVHSVSGAAVRASKIEPGAQLATSDEPVRFGTDGAKGAAPWTGALDEVRIWNTVRLPVQLSFYLRRGIDSPSTHADLAAYWTFDEHQGQAVVDQCNAAPGSLQGVSDVERAEDPYWIPTALTSTWHLWVNGAELGAVPVWSPMPIATTQPRLGTADGAHAFPGYLAEVRVWRTLRTAAQLAANQFRRLRGDEDGLVAYWPCDDNSRGTHCAISDRTAAPCDAQGSVTSSANVVTWPSPSDALHFGPPIGDDVPYGVPASAPSVSPVARAVVLGGPPSVAELSDGSGRIHVALAPGGTSFLTDAHLDTDGTDLVYLGQIQTDARVVGFIEGAPPVPSENLSLESPNTPDRYGDTAKVSLGQSASVNYSGIAKASLGLGFDLKAHRGTDFEANAAIMFPIEVDLGHFDGERKVSAGGDLELAGRLTSNARGSATTETESSLSIAGAFQQNLYKLDGVTSSDENATQPDRLYRPDNVGMAVVRSLTADLYALRSKRTGAIVSYQAVADKDIPPDTNLIMFDLNPLYTKNGTLDGRIGFDNDVHYATLAPTAHGSYYKVQEAYATKAKILRQRAEYSDFFACLGKLAISATDASTDRVAEQARVSAVNTYVWTAGGGLRCEEMSGAASRRDALGVELDAGAFIGMETKFDALTGAALMAGVAFGVEHSFSLKFEGVFTIASGAKAEVNLEVEVTGEGFLNQRAIPVAGVDVTGWAARPAMLRSGTPDGLTQSLLDAGLVTPFAISFNPTTYGTQYRIYQDANQTWFLEDSHGKYTAALNDDETQGTFTPCVGTGQYPINYREESCPGKVRSYRFSTFYLEPSAENFALLAGAAEPIIDPEWLADGTNPDAVALRVALTRPNEAWRVFHRTTYVNRVPRETEGESGGERVEPSAEPVAAVVVPSPLRRPDEISLARNALVIRLLLGDVPDLASSLPNIHADQTDANIDTVVTALANDFSVFSLPESQRIALANRLHDYMTARAAPETASLS